MSIIYPINISVPIENKAEFDRLFQERNNLIGMYNDIMRRIKDIQPTKSNYMECEKTLSSISGDVDGYGKTVMQWITDFSVYELNLRSQYDGSIKESFEHIGFKLMISNFIRDMHGHKDVTLKSFNDVANWIKTQETLDITSNIKKFAKHNPVFFVIELLIHLAVIYVGLKELHLINF